MFYAVPARRNPLPLLYSIGKVTVGKAMILGWRPHVEGLEHIPTTGGAIFAGNHLSVADELFLGAVVPRHLAFWAKAEYFSGEGETVTVTVARAA